MLFCKSENNSYLWLCNSYMYIELWQITPYLSALTESRPVLKK